DHKLKWSGHFVVCMIRRRAILMLSVLRSQRFKLTAEYSEGTVRRARSEIEGDVAVAVVMAKAGQLLRRDQQAGIVETQLILQPGEHHEVRGGRRLEAGGAHVHRRAHPICG